MQMMYDIIAKALRYEDLYTKENSFDVIVDGIEKSIIQAHENLRPGSIFVNKGELLDAGINRSPGTYLNNPSKERDHFKYNVNKDMTLLKFVDAEWGPVGSFNWFTTHGTSMGRTNSLISGDNKGAAARLMEDWFKQKSSTSSTSKEAESSDFAYYSSPSSGMHRRVSSIITHTDNGMHEIAALLRSTGGRPTTGMSSIVHRVRSSIRHSERPEFVATFCQSNVTDVSPNVLGTFCIDTGLPCDFNYSTCDGKNELCYGRGLGYPDEFSSTCIIGERQFKKASILGDVTTLCMGTNYSSYSHNKDWPICHPLCTQRIHNNVWQMASGSCKGGLKMLRDICLGVHKAWRRYVRDLERLILVICYPRLEKVTVDPKKGGGAAKEGREPLRKDGGISRMRDKIHHSIWENYI
eukprot:Gb_40657 [translate_table: standard]